jgi:hypothetical protein
MPLPCFGALSTSESWRPKTVIHVHSDVNQILNNDSDWSVQCSSNSHQKYWVSDMIKEFNERNTSASGLC